MKTAVKLIRVTTVLDWLESHWKQYWWRSVGFEKADKISRESAQFGTRVHELIGKVLLEDCLLDATKPESYCALTITNYLKEHNIKPLFDSYHTSLEVEVKDKKLGLVGHFDYAAMVDGVPTIIDFKTSNKMRKSFPLQKSAYAKMANRQFGVKINKGLTLRSHWNKETMKVEFEVKEYNNLLKVYWPIFNCGLKVYKYFN